MGVAILFLHHNVLSPYTLETQTLNRHQTKIQSLFQIYD